MSARQVMYYQAQCDCCGLVHDDYGDFSAFSDPDTAINNVSEDWAQVGGEDLCEACWCWPDAHPDYPGDNEWTGGDDPIRAHDAHPGKYPIPEVSATHTADTTPGRTTR